MLFYCQLGNRTLISGYHQSVFAPQLIQDLLGQHHFRNHIIPKLRSHS